MRNYTVESPTFTKAISIVEEDDLVNEENDTAAAKQLIGNDLVLNDRMERCLGKDPAHGDSKNLIITFESGDAASATAWTNVDVMQSKEEHKSLFGKISTMMKNVRYLYRLLGTTDISSIGDGTITDAIKKLKEDQPGDATQSVHGLMTAIDKAKLDGIDNGANAYTHPQTHDASMIGQNETHRFVSDIEKNTWNNKLNKSDVSRSTAVTVEGQKALDAIENNAAVPGTMAYNLEQINSNLTAKATTIANRLLVNDSFTFTMSAGHYLIFMLSNNGGTYAFNAYVASSEFGSDQHNLLTQIVSNVPTNATVTTNGDSVISISSNDANGCRVTVTRL